MSFLSVGLCWCSAMEKEGRITRVLFLELISIGNRVAHEGGSLHPSMCQKISLFSETTTAVCKFV